MNRINMLLAVFFNHFKLKSKQKIAVEKMRYAHPGITGQNLTAQRWGHRSGSQVRMLPSTGQKKGTHPKARPFHILY
ncbi:MAG: hypothetical protein D3916_15895 [Candidatus Electrothrix sp. MAN1_4]|nr:hypothetical protein [Candidatus Electrothrix sp. MAN1_4]